MELLHYFVLYTIASCAVWAADGVDDPSPGEEVRQDLVKAVDGKDGVSCPKVEDMNCPRRDITFWLYTRETQDNPTHLDSSSDESLRNAPFVKGSPLIILVHGYTMDKNTAINKVLRPAYFSHGEYNIISVDWSSLCRDHCYQEAAVSIPTIGHCVALFVSGLLSMHYDTFCKVHVLGHSMGAHVCSWASQELNLPRLTQFDPALPLFSDDDQLYKRPTAQFVDVWHTNSGLKGREAPSGTVDIYFNDEMDQPGCKCDASCSHLRAVQYYAETISHGALAGFPCRDGWEGYRNNQCSVPQLQDLGYFGETHSHDKQGEFLAFTRSQSPFIVPAEDYLNEQTFKSFEKTQDEQCTKHDFMSFFGELFHI